MELNDKTISDIANKVTGEYILDESIEKDTMQVQAFILGVNSMVEKLQDFARAEVFKKGDRVEYGHKVYEVEGVSDDKSILRIVCVGEDKLVLARDCKLECPF